MMEYPNFSVLLSVYNKEKSENLKQALNSIWNLQSVKPTEIVLVKDGSLTPELDAVIAEFSLKSPLKIVSLPINQGLGRALNEGIKHCSCEWIARMDSDDISMPDRFEIQLHYVKDHPDVDLVGAWVSEFEDEISNVRFVKKVPSSDKEILVYAQQRNPLNHPVVLFRKQTVIQVGGYQHCPLFEDYWLWVRMLKNGYKVYNIPRSLLWFRASDDMFKRRGGLRYIYYEYQFQKKIRKLGFITRSTFLKNMGVRCFFRMIPNRFRVYLYKVVLRDKE